MAFGLIPGKTGFTEKYLYSVRCIYSLKYYSLNMNLSKVLWVSNMILPATVNISLTTCSTLVL